MLSIFLISGSSTVWINRSWKSLSSPMNRVRTTQHLCRDSWKTSWPDVELFGHPSFKKTTQKSGAATLWISLNFREGIYWVSIQCNYGICWCHLDPRILLLNMLTVCCFLGLWWDMAKGLRCSCFWRGPIRRTAWVVAVQAHRQASAANPVAWKTQGTYRKSWSFWLRHLDFRSKIMWPCSSVRLQFETQLSTQTFGCWESKFGVRRLHQIRGVTLDPWAVPGVNSHPKDCLGMFRHWASKILEGQEP